MPFDTIAQGTQSGIAQARQHAIRGAEEWSELWQAHAQPRVPRPPLPNVDFSREMAVAVFAGEKPSGGYTIEITGLARDRGSVTVIYRQSSPPPGAAVIQVLTQPFHIIRLARLDLPVTFQEQ